MQPCIHCIVYCSSLCVYQIPSSTELPHAGGQPPSPSSGGAPIALAGAARPDTIGLQAPSHVDHSSEQMQVISVLFE